jgi:hypothetical protein
MPSWHVENLIQVVADWCNYLAQQDSKEEAVALVASILADQYTTDPGLAALYAVRDVANPDSSFMRQLRQLISCQKSAVGITAKAQMLATRIERQYSSAAVSTDIRPIFGGNIEAAPEQAVILHHLAISFLQDGRMRMVSLGMSSQDILNLAGVLNRAWSKDRTLRGQSDYKIIPII